MHTRDHAWSCFADPDRAISRLRTFEEFTGSASHGWCIRDRGSRFSRRVTRLRPVSVSDIPALSAHAPFSWRACGGLPAAEERPVDTRGDWGDARPASADCPVSGAARRVSWTARHGTIWTARWDCLDSSAGLSGQLRGIIWRVRRGYKPAAVVGLSDRWATAGRVPLCSAAAGGSKGQLVKCRSRRRRTNHNRRLEGPPSPTPKNSQHVPYPHEWVRR